ncbi:cell division ATP-binding protein FtsE [Flavilitoribacter nigricans]|uniref:Cell division ATP-binding protein FtsE n=1 Tax=Flavilitoribacter nigricans (strain ATCC 23147 / DSM 23189 / NBRC 102662 / NCIMB 1420 / SS-2) TaxID=1122177 RepID=A0A2D0NCY6_FLAN2|nr:ATP-binding cassette domain-containing protein [Flavilitoribacter nigricans]PHN06374.1 phosphonate ABC transporter ATP-binding protein [Flavilitoribacter nigricans DSM 23189 = NBRC 102662]
MSNLIVQLNEAGIFQQKHQVLNAVNLKISRGEFTYLIGKTGSGKSSLLKTLYGALPLKVGKGIVAGYDLGSLDRKTIPLLRRELGIVFQDFNLLPDRSVQENLRFVLEATGWKEESKIKERIREVLQQVGLQEKYRTMPHKLSGGEQQRVVIARALLNEPQIILADEPTGNLDPETSDDILLLLRQLAQKHNTAVLFATHDYRIIENFPARIIRCLNGRIITEEDIEV